MFAPSTRSTTPRYWTLTKSVIGVAFAVEQSATPRAAAKSFIPIPLAHTVCGSPARGGLDCRADAGVVPARPRRAAEGSGAGYLRFLESLPAKTGDALAGGEGRAVPGSTFATRLA